MTDCRGAESMEEALLDRITADPAIFGGKPKLVTCPLPATAFASPAPRNPDAARRRGGSLPDFEHLFRAR
jgi:hypothetical protein